MITQTPLYDVLHDNIVTALEERAAEDAAYNPAYNFEVFKERTVPVPGSINGRVIVNVNLPKVDPVPGNSANRNFVTRNCLFNIDMFVESAGTDVENADKIVDTRIKFLSEQVWNCLTDNKNVNFGLDKIHININLALEFFGKQDDRNSSTVFAVARYIFTAEIPYSTAALENLSDLTTLNLNISDLWSVEFNYD